MLAVAWLLVVVVVAVLVMFSFFNCILNLTL